MRRVERIQRLRNTIPELQNARLTLLASLVDSGDDERLIAEYEANERSRVMAAVAGSDLRYQADRIEALEAEVERLRAALERLLDANATREHEGMPQEEWDAVILATEEALAGEGDE